MFARASAARTSRKGTSGSWQVTHNNLVSGIAKCGVCGGRMKQEVTVKKGGNRRNGKNPDAVYEAKQDISYLKCHNALNRVFDERLGRVRCDNRNWVRYEKLERSVVEFASGWVAKNRHGAPSADIAEVEVQVAEVRRLMEGKQQEADNAAVSFTQTRSPTMERLMLKLEAEVAEMAKEVKALEGRLMAMRSSAPSPDFLALIEKQQAAVFSEDEAERYPARVAMKQTLGTLIRSMECDAERNTHIVIGDNAMRLSFDAEGQLIGTDYGQGTIYTGPNGEIDWHPDFPDADYEYAA